jgi:hypothetical protein
MQSGSSIQVLPRRYGSLIAPARRAWPQWALGLLVFMLSTMSFTAVPPAWYDEGINLQAAANLARGLGYGLLYDGGGLHRFDKQLTTGPTVIAPVAASFALFGIGLAQGRAVTLVYSLLAAVGLYQAGRRLYGSRVGLVAVLVLCAANDGGPASTRDVIGEVAALAFLVWGVTLLVAAEADTRFVAYAAAGLLLGFAVVTKAQFAIAVPSLVAGWLISRAFTARHLAAILTGLVLPTAMWQGLQLVVLGPDGFRRHLQDQSAILSVSASVPPLSRAAIGAQYLLSSPVALAGLAGLVYVWYLALRPSARRSSAARLFLAAFATVWLAWYAGFSMAWPRYAMVLVGIGSLFAAVLMCDLCRSVRTWLRGVLVVVLALPVVAGIVLHLGDLARPPEPAAQQMVDLIAEILEPRAPTESFEWELDVLGLEHFHHPSRCVSCPAIPYDVPSETRYLVDGPSSKIAQLYRRELSSSDYRRVASAGPYDLYRREPLGLAR